MIIKFSVTNYKSIKDTLSLDFASNSHIPLKPEHKIKFGRLGVLKNIGIYGANASGKTTIINAISDMRQIIVNPISVKTLAFKGQENLPTTFDICFEMDNRFYEYQYSVIFNENLSLLQVLDESLYELFLNGKNQEIYSRAKGTADTKNEVLSTFQKGYRNTLGILFLTYIVAPERQIKGNETIKVFNNIYNYFLKNFFISLHARELLLSVCTESVSIIKNKLHDYDTGIENVDFENISESEKDKLFSDPFITNIIIKNLAKSNKDISQYFCNGDDIFVFSKEQQSIITKKLVFKHQNIDKKFSFKEESEGTKIIFLLIATLICSENNERSIFIDEIERSSHPLVVTRVIEDFMIYNKNKKNQLVFTSHLNSLMDLVLQKDEIYFVEKDNNGVSHLSSLQDYESRNRREKVGEKYIEGRYGAIPNLGVYIK